MGLEQDGFRARIIKSAAQGKLPVFLDISAATPLSKEPDRCNKQRNLNACVLVLATPAFGSEYQLYDPQKAEELKQEVKKVSKP